MQRQPSLVIALVEQHRKYRRRAGESLRRQPEALFLGGTLAGNVVGGNDVDAAIGQCGPEGIAIRRTPKRRICLAHPAKVHVACVRQVMRAGFDEDTTVTGLPAPGLLDPHFGTHVRNVDRRPELFRHEHRSNAVFGFSDCGLDGFPLRQVVDAVHKLCVAKSIDDFDVLRVADDGQPADLRSGLEQVIEIAVVRAVQPKVPALLALEVHEIFERRNAVLRDVAFQLLQVRFTCRAEMKTVVHIGARPGIALFTVVDIRIAFVIQEERQDR